MTSHHISCKFFFMENVASKIGIQIRAARKSKRITQREVSQKTGLDQAYISRLENGTAEGSPTQILNIARTIGVSIAQLYNEQEDTLNKMVDLSDEAIEFARSWQALPVQQRVAIKAAVEALGSNL